MEVAKKGRGVEAFEVEGALENTRDLLEAVLERMEDLLPRLSRLSALDQVLEKPGPGVGRREVRHGADEGGFEVESRLSAAA